MATATVFLLCGLPGSGKTTLAKRLEAERPALRFNEDEWATRLYAPEDAHADDKRDAIKDVQWRIAVRAVRLGLDVVLDWGVWARSERDGYRSRAAADGVSLKLLYLDVPRQELMRRLATRNATLPADTFHISEDMLDRYWSEFQPPSADELDEPTGYTITAMFRGEVPRILTPGRAIRRVQAHKKSAARIAAARGRDASASAGAGVHRGEGRRLRDGTG